MASILVQEQKQGASAKALGLDEYMFDYEELTAEQMVWVACHSLALKQPGL